MSPARSVTTLALLLLLLPFISHAISYCGGPCGTLDDCYGQLICINGKCDDDPDVGTHICPHSPPPPRPSPPSRPPTTPSPCRQFGTLTCGGTAYPTYKCSPPISTGGTAAILTLNSFEKGGDGGAESECDGQFHSNKDPIVALSTGWYSGGSRCFKQIVIRANNGRSVKATVVDECDSMNGCDSDHAYQPPCRNNIVDGSQAVWNALGLNSNVGEASVTWTMA